MGQKNGIIYFDYAATSPVIPAVAKTVSEYIKEEYGNASSLYSIGDANRARLNFFREIIAMHIGCCDDEIYFTSGGTESDNWALRGTLNPGDHMITSSFEHLAILNTCKYLEGNGIEVSYVAPNKDGIVHPEDVLDCVRDNTKLVSVMMVNNEIGTIQPIKEISRIVKSKKPDIIIHTDAVQAVGHLKIDVKNLGIDMLSASSHKFGGPKGVGFLYSTTGIDLKPMMFGGHQENNLRPGTENVPCIAGMAEALNISMTSLKETNERIHEVRDELLDTLMDIGAEPNITHNNVEHIISVNIPGTNAQDMVILLSELGICASAGSACNAGDDTPSHVLKAIGLDDEIARSTLRFSYGYGTKYSDATKFATIIRKNKNLFLRR